MIFDDEPSDAYCSAQCRALQRVQWVNTMQRRELSGLYIQSPKLNQLNILREVAADAHITQAELATRCSLSVAMVNNYMKDLCKSGLLEYHRKSIKSVTYHLTPEGAEQVETLQLELISEMAGMFAISKEQIWARIASQSHKTLKRAVLFGSGHLAQLVFHALELAGVNTIGICDDDIELIGGDFCGREVISPELIRPLNPDAVIAAKSPEMPETNLILQSLSDAGIAVIRLDARATGSVVHPEVQASPIPPGVPAASPPLSLSLPRDR
jgi:predicted transcriptional regulator